MNYRNFFYPIICLFFSALISCSSTGPDGEFSMVSHDGSARLNVEGDFARITFNLKNNLAESCEGKLTDAEPPIDLVLHGKQYLEVKDCNYRFGLFYDEQANSWFLVFIKFGNMVHSQHQLFSHGG